MKTEIGVGMELPCSTSSGAATIDSHASSRMRTISAIALWTPLASPNRIARRRVKVCAATRLDLDAPSTVRHWDDNGGHLKTLL